MNKFIAVVLSMLALTCQVSTADTRADDDWRQTKEKIAGMAAVADIYRNVEYGFSVSVLEKKGYKPTEQDPDHGILIVLGDRRTISVSAMYDAAPYGSAKAALADWIDNEHIKSVKRGQASLAGKPAVQATWAKGDEIKKVLIQWRGEKVDSGILYEFEMITDNSHQGEDFKTFDAITKTFKTHVLPK